MYVVYNVSELAYYSAILSGACLVFSEKAAPGPRQAACIIIYPPIIFISSKITKRSSLYKDMKTLQPCKNQMKNRKAESSLKVVC